MQAGSNHIPDGFIFGGDQVSTGGFVEIHRFMANKMITVRSIAVQSN
jgi:hypothetical protein